MRAGEHVHCTIDGSVPTQASPLCHGAIVVTKSSTVVKAIVLGENLEPSPISETQPIEVQCYPPRIEPFGGVFVNHVLVTIKSSQVDTTVYYTTDGSVPSTFSRIYAGPFDIVESGDTVSAMSVSSVSCGNSPVKSSNPVLIKTLPPIIEPGKGIFMLDGSQNTVAITSSPGSLVYFTVQVGDSNPFPFSHYQKPIVIERTGTRIKAVAIRDGLEGSDTTTSDPYIVMAVKPTIKIPSGVSVGKALVEISTITPASEKSSFVEHDKFFMLT